MQTVKRNAERFPDDFMFRLTRAETETLNRSRIVTGSQKHRDPRFPPYGFTEHGAILNSSRAIEMSSTSHTTSAATAKQESSEVVRSSDY